jgi:hypothetical protein
MRISFICSFPALVAVCAFAPAQSISHDPSADWLVNPQWMTNAHVDTNGVLRWQDKGAEVSLFGVNYYTPFWHNFPDLKAVGADHRKVIDQDVAHFARIGLDALRLHVFDREISDRDGNLLDNEHLQLLDYLIARAKERGIYTVVTPIAWWSVPGDSPGFSTRFTMPQMITDPEARRAQTNYLAQFLCHVNPHTKLAYKDDPAIVCIELINEPQYGSDTRLVVGKRQGDPHRAAAHALWRDGARHSQHGPRRESEPHQTHPGGAVQDRPAPAGEPAAGPAGGWPHRGDAQPAEGALGFPDGHRAVLEAQPAGIESRFCRNFHSSSVTPESIRGIQTRVFNTKNRPLFATLSQP